MAKKCISDEEFNEIKNLFGKNYIHEGGLRYIKGISANCEKSRYYHTILFVYFPEYADKVISYIEDKFGRNIEFETKLTPNEHYTEQLLKDYTKLFKLNERFNITKQNPICELRIRGYCD